MRLPVAQRIDTTQVCTGTQRDHQAGLLANGFQACLILPASYDDPSIKAICSPRPRSLIAHAEIAQFQPRQAAQGGLKRIYNGKLTPLAAREIEEGNFRFDSSHHSASSKCLIWAYENTGPSNAGVDIVDLAMATFTNATLHAPSPKLSRYCLPLMPSTTQGYQLHPKRSDTLLVVHM